MVKEYRYELKYTITKQTAELLKKQLGLLMQKDPHSVCDEYSYFIRSIYFDDLYSSSYYEKVDGIEYRHKYRIRMYNMDSSILKLECKVKDDNMTYKYDANVSKEVAAAIIDGKYDLIQTKNEFINRFLIEAKQRRLKATTIVDYKRTAYIYPVSNVRITFDQELRSGRYSNNFFTQDDYTFEIFPEDLLVMEVKFDEFIPEQLVTVLSSVPTIRQAVSKFALCHSIK